MEIKRDETLTEAQQLAAYVLRFHMRPLQPTASLRNAPLVT